MEAQDTITSKLKHITEHVIEVLFDVLESRQKKNETEETDDNGKHDSSDIIDGDV